MYDGLDTLDMSKLPKYDFNRFLYKPSKFRDFVDYVAQKGKSIVESLRNSGRGIAEKLRSTEQR